MSNKIRAAVALAAIVPTACLVGTANAAASIVVMKTTDTATPATNTNLGQTVCVFGHCITY